MTSFSAAADLKPTACAVLVQNISPHATEKAVRDFFSFCGKIAQFQLSSNGETQQAFILFDKESAANTARLLTNAVIVDRSVTVQSYFEAHKDSDPAAAVEADERKANESKDAEHKSYTTVVAELLAGGYTLTSPVVRRGIEMDAKYGVSASLVSFFNTAQAKAQALDEKYGVTALLKSTAVEIDQKLHIKDKADVAIARGKEIGVQAMNTPVGQKVAAGVGFATNQAKEVVSETRSLVDERTKATATTTPSSTDAASSASATGSSITQPK